MAYVIFETESTRILRQWRRNMYRDAVYATEAAAKAALTRHTKASASTVKYSIATVQDFAKIEKTVVVKNLMSGKDVVQSVNTPRSCDVSSETYWSL